MTVSSRIQVGDSLEKGKVLNISVGNGFATVSIHFFFFNFYIFPEIICLNEGTGKSRILVVNKK